MLAGMANRADGQSSDDRDLVVIGSGSAGSTVAHRCRAAGWNVSVVDERPFGGTCALRGCDPKKVLVGAADAVDQVRRLGGKGVSGKGASIDWPALMQWKRSFTDDVPATREKSFREAGVEPLHGRAQIVERAADGRLVVGITSAERTVTRLARHLVIATGAAPARLSVPGEELLRTSDDFLSLETLPRRILFVGGGYIAFEFAHVAATAGAEVTIVHRSTDPLAGFDSSLVERLVAHTRARGIDVVLETAVTRIAKAGPGVEVSAEGPDGTRRFSVDLAIHAAGRTPALAGMGLEAAGVKYARNGVAVGSYMQSVSNPAVYAAGDAAMGGLPLTPVAAHEARVVATNLVEGNRMTVDYRGLPTVVFTDPPLAAVGLTEEAARVAGHKVGVKSADTTGWYTNRRLASPAGGFKVILDQDGGGILGAHVLGPGAEDLINVFALAIRFGIPARELRSALLSYPSVASDIEYML